MIHIQLKRTDYLSDCTLGIMTISDFKCYTIERPWLDNKPRLSCIPVGAYRFIPHNWRMASKFKFSRVWQIMNVPNRTGILIHNGNTADDVIGCVAVGAIRGKLRGKNAVLESRKTLEKLRAIIGDDGGLIEVF